MSTSYRPSRRMIPWSKIKNIRGIIWETITPDTDENSACITDGYSHLWAFKCGKSTRFERYGINDVENIINELEKEFKVKIISEHDKKYWK